jgi:hypothetical protein
MKGDFSRETFDPDRHYAGVLMQQGRVLLDADFNEQGAILRHLSRTLARDLVGPHGGPSEGLGFDCLTSELELQQWRSRCRASDATTDANLARVVDWARDFVVAPGRYYVDGMAVENTALVRYAELAGPGARDALSCGDDCFVVYLQAFERVVTALDDPRLADPALGGTDTALRVQARWGMFLEARGRERVPAGDLPLRSRVRYGLMAAQTRPPRADDSPAGGYTGNENRLYRVEIHAGGETGAPSFKWSRDNGACVRAIRRASAGPARNALTVELFAASVAMRACAVDVDSFVELLPEFDPGPHVQGPLLRVIAAGGDGNALTLRADRAVGDVRRLRLARRWDQPSAAIPVPADGTPIGIEEGIEISFDAATRPDLRSGDYWLVPARPSVGDVVWPRAADDTGGPPRSLPRRPDGPRAACAPIGVLHRAHSRAPWRFDDARKRFGPLAK